MTRPTISTAYRRGETWTRWALFLAGLAFAIVIALLLADGFVKAETAVVVRLVGI